MSGTGLSRYVALVGAATPYARRMTYLRNRIFGEVVRPLPTRNQRVLQLLSDLPVQQNPEITNYYPRHVETHLLMQKLRYYGLFRDEHEDFKDEMKRVRALRGKSKPQRNEGKRANKK